MSKPCLRSLDTNELLNRMALGSCTDLEAELARRLDEASEYIADLQLQVEALEALLDEEGQQDVTAPEVAPVVAEGHSP